MNPCKHKGCPNKTSHESGYCFKHKDYEFEPPLPELKVVGTITLQLTKVERLEPLEIHWE